MERTGVGPGSLNALRTILAETRQRGYAVEDGEVTTGFASVAAPVLDHNDLPLAGVAVTYPAPGPAGTAVDVIVVGGKVGCLGEFQKTDGFGRRCGIDDRHVGQL